MSDAGFDGALRPRRGARSYREIDPRVLACLNSGDAEAATHVEQMAVDMRMLARKLFTVSTDEYAIDHPQFLERMREGGRLVLDLFGAELWSEARTWKSDTARCWAAMAVGMVDVPLVAKIRLATAWARDPHFGVREFAWLGVRGDVRDRTVDALDLLTAIAASPDLLDRRFAIEVARPIRVWGVHLGDLKRSPELGRDLIDLYVCEADRYPATAAANWIRDAARCDREWAAALVERWSTQCLCQRTQWIVQRVRRSL